MRKFLPLKNSFLCQNFLEIKVVDPWKGSEAKNLFWWIKTQMILRFVCYEIFFRENEEESKLIKQVDRFIISL